MSIVKRSNAERLKVIARYADCETDNHRIGAMAVSIATMEAENKSLREEVLALRSIGP